MLLGNEPSQGGEGTDSEQAIEPEPVTPREPSRLPWNSRVYLLRQSSNPASARDGLYSIRHSAEVCKASVSLSVKEGHR